MIFASASEQNSRLIEGFRVLETVERTPMKSLGGALPADADRPMMLGCEPGPGRDCARNQTVIQYRKPLMCHSYQEADRLPRKSSTTVSIDHVCGSGHFRL